MIGWFFWSAMYLARAIEYAVQAGWSLIVSLVWFLSLVGLGANESGLTVVSSVLSPLLRRLCLLRRSLPLLFLASEGLASLAVFLL